MVELLKGVSYLRVIPSQANYICCEVLEGIRGEELAQKLLAENILIKNLTEKIDNGREYIRLAIRTDAENKRLVDCLMEMGRNK